MINRADLLKSLQTLLPHIEKDILAYSEANSALGGRLQSEYQAAVQAERVAEHFVSWREAQITQAAVSWVLTCVFVRFLEDNNLLSEPALAGPTLDAQGENALQQAKERMVAYFNESPEKEERDYLLDLFADLKQYPVMAELLDERHNPLWQIPVSADGAKQLIDFFQKIDADSGKIQHDFSDPSWDTRFLGDLYQDLSESVRKRYALLQTPEFVESFILDYTLEPAIEAFGLPGLRLIDPTCGSGHFLLTSFERVFNRWLKREPGTNTRELAQRALSVVHGVDINPYAIAVCRFRLFIAAMQAAGSSKIKDAPAFTFNLACGDSLLHGKRFEWEGQGDQQDMLVENSHVYEVEDADKLNKILGQQYHVVVGNPPYITVKDRALNQIYRNKYLTCFRKYSLGVPFTERFFDLTLEPEGNRAAGFIGMITTNSFMKREFGKKLIEEYLPNKDLTHVIDTSGAFIPGHGTPTVILFARNQKPVSSQIQAVLGIKGEPGTPEDASKGKVWTSITQLLIKGNAESDFVSVARQDRTAYEKHPWSVGGGGAAELKEKIDAEATSFIEQLAEGLGFGAITGEDDIYLLSNGTSYLSGSEFQRVFVEGDKVRDWDIDTSTGCVFPYNDALIASANSEILNRFWPARTTLKSRKYFGKSQEERGMTWYEYGYVSKEKCASKYLIAFAFVATHNHFVLDRGGKVFKQSAPVIQLSDSATESDHFALLGLLNSSTACFWGRQTFFSKRGEDVGRWGEFMEFDATKLKRFPIPERTSKEIISLASELDCLSGTLAKYSPNKIINLTEKNLSSNLQAAHLAESEIWQKMISLQEELDWHVYYQYGLTDSLVSCREPPPLIRLGERAFEISMGGKIKDNKIPSWFSRHNSAPITDIPMHWPLEYQELIEKRLRIMESNPYIKLIEQPEHKRRWARDCWDKRVKVAAKEWLLGKIESVAQQPELFTCAQLTDKLRADAKTQQIAEIYTDGSVLDLQALVSELVASDQVPQMAAARYKPSAMDKWFAWQETWGKQRLEDAIDAKHGVTLFLSECEATDLSRQAEYEVAKQAAEAEKLATIGQIPVPPAYKQADFRQVSFWTLRGKLDVPKERFFSLPGCEKGGDTTMVVGWAGLNHLQRAQAIATWYLECKEREGWDAQRLMPMLVALDELIPWLKQWHNEVDPEYGERMGDYYEGFLLEELRTLEIVRADLQGWQPPALTRRRSAGKKKAAK